MGNRLRTIWQSWRWRRMTRPLMRRHGYHELITALITTLAILNGASSGAALADSGYAAWVKTELADEVMDLPNQWERSIDEREAAHRNYAGQGISSYRATLERQALQAFKPQALEMATRLRNARDDDLKRYGLGQVLQGVSATFGGKYVGGVLGKEAGDAVGGLLNWEWNAQSIVSATAGDDLAVNWEAKRDYMRQYLGHLMDQDLQAWDAAEPLVRARLHRTIRYLQLNRDQWSDEEYREQLRERAISIDQSLSLTQGAGSADSPFADYTALMGWLAQEAGRAEPAPTQQDPANKGDTTQPPPDPEPDLIAVTIDREAELHRLWNDCTAKTQAANDAVCARTNGGSGCAVTCENCLWPVVVGAFSEYWWDLDSAFGPCALAAAQAYVDEINAANGAVAAGPMYGSEYDALRRQAHDQTDAALDACREETCQAFCAAQNKIVDTVGIHCNCH